MLNILRPDAGTNRGFTGQRWEQHRHVKFRNQKKERREVLQVSSRHAGDVQVFITNTNMHNNANVNSHPAQSSQPLQSISQKLTVVTLEELYDITGHEVKVNSMGWVICEIIQDRYIT